MVTFREDELPTFSTRLFGGVSVVTIIISPGTDGTLTDALGITCNEVDVALENNSAMLTTTVFPLDHPPLSVAYQPTNQIILPWPGWAEGFVLQATTNLSASDSWTQILPPTNVIGEMILLTNTPAETSSSTASRRRPRSLEQFAKGS